VSRTTAIVAVFGSSKSLGIATQLGSAIASNEEILLTGGSGAENLSKEEKATVKEKAIAGADSARLPGKRARWIGITRGSDVPSYSILREGQAFVAATDLNHRRNCIEACLCDAAVAIEGGKGSVSEAIFCLSLGKPVVFIGNGWKKYRVEGATRTADFDAMVKDAFDRVGSIPETDAPLDQLFDPKRVLAQATSFAGYKWLPTPLNAAREAVVVADSLGWLRKSARINGKFPNIARYADIISAYCGWL
jgi:predicted Rossmann-fold nucleotide-binding protein